jgi:hypothetical protein
MHFVEAPNGQYPETGARLHCPECEDVRVHPPEYRRCPRCKFILQFDGFQYTCPATNCEYEEDERR